MLSGGGEALSGPGPIGIRVASVHDLTVYDDETLPRLAGRSAQEHNHLLAPRHDEPRAAHGALPHGLADLTHAQPQGLEGWCCCTFACGAHRRSNIERAHVGP